MARRRYFEEDADVLTLSVHGSNNFPFRKQASKIDVGLPDGTGAMMRIWKPSFRCCPGLRVPAGDCVLSIGRGRAGIRPARPAEAHARGSGAAGSARIQCVPQHARSLRDYTGRRLFRARRTDGGSPRQHIPHSCRSASLDQHLIRSRSPRRQSVSHSGTDQTSR